MGKKYSHRIDWISMPYEEIVKALIVHGFSVKTEISESMNGVVVSIFDGTSPPLSSSHVTLWKAAVSVCRAWEDRHGIILRGDVE